MAYWDDVTSVANALAAVAHADLDDERVARMAKPLAEELTSLIAELCSEGEGEVDDDTKVDPSEPLISWDELRECKADYDHETGAPRVFFGSLHVHASTASELADRILKQVRLAAEMEEGKA